MIRCHFARLLGERKLRIATVHRVTNIDRGTLTRLYNETAVRVEMEVIDTLCRYLGCGVGDLLEFIPDDRNTPAIQ